MNSEHTVVCVLYKWRTEKQLYFDVNLDSKHIFVSSVLQRENLKQNLSVKMVAEEAVQPIE